MTIERWQRIDKLFQSAIERTPEERADFIRDACGDDESLRAEVESLVVAHERTGEFLDAPAYEVTGVHLANDLAKLIIGQTIGHYKILGSLGTGGMGEVYLAEDTRLGRKIALKLLPREFTKDADRVRRFEREARAASALSHPNVCVIHEIDETEEGCQFIAMEYIEGATLRQRMAQKRLELSETLNFVTQVAEALVAAHGAGVIHRDIKPENVMVRSDGLVKVLDFGLAKLAERQTTEIDAQALTRSLLQTGSGMIMGTAAYMSPEQARGLAVDARTDVWSLGVVLYEMIAGRPPFAAPTPSDMLVSILDRSPRPLASESNKVPAELERIIRKCLEKEREQRYQSAGQLLDDLKNLKRDPESGQVAPLNAAASRQLGWRASSVAMISALLLVIGGATWIYFSRGASKPPLPPMKIVTFTTLTGFERDSAFSPDGNRIAFYWESEKADEKAIYIKTIGEETLLRLTPKSAPGDSPTWSPDGGSIAFARTSYKGSDGGIFRVSATGGPERKLFSPLMWNDQDWIEPGLDWSPDGKWIAFPNKTASDQPYSIFLLSLDSLEPQRLTFPEVRAGDIYPVFSPDGKTLAFSRVISGASDVYLLPVTGGEAKRLTFDEHLIHNLAWTSDGREIVFSSNRGGKGWNLWRISATGGIPEAVGPIEENASNVAVARHGNRLAYTHWYGDADIYRIDLSRSSGRDELPTRLISSTSIDNNPQFSPDGKKIVFSSGRSGGSEIWTCDADGSNPVQLTSIESGADDPYWSPDGRQIAFNAENAGAINIFIVDSEGGKPRRLTSGSSHDLVLSWSRNGLIYFSSDRSGTWQVWRLPVVAGGEPVQVTENGGAAPLESSDGKFVYYAKSDAPGIWRIPKEGGKEEEVFDLYQPGKPWALLDQGIFFCYEEAQSPLTPVPDVALLPASRPTIEFYNFAARRVSLIARLERVPEGFAVSPDGRWLLYTQFGSIRSDIMLLENFR